MIRLGVRVLVGASLLALGACGDPCSDSGDCPSMMAGTGDASTGREPFGPMTTELDSTAADGSASADGEGGGASSVDLGAGSASAEGGSVDDGSVDDGPASTDDGSVDDGPASTDDGSVDDGPASTDVGSVDDGPVGDGPASTDDGSVDDGPDGSVTAESGLDPTHGGGSESTDGGGATDDGSAGTTSGGGATGDGGGAGGTTSAGPSGESCPDCPSGLCVAGVCVECTEEDISACPEGYVCDPNLLECVPDLPGDQCINNVDCDASLGCGGGYCLRCQSNGGFCSPCDENGDCSGETWLCNEALNSCVFCLEDDGEFGCKGDDVCHAYGDCDPPCTYDADCSYDGFVCSAGYCVPAV
jgi:hypothetical protein